MYKQEALDSLECFRSNTAHILGDNDEKVKTIETCMMLVREAEETEQKHGKWIIRDNPGTGWYRVTCSECGEDVTSTIPMIGFFPNAKPLWDYCPYCGAEMEVENNGKQ